ncbi:cbb3-type cytochrome c oxidase subunit I [Bradyrhizobium viridifuturi]|uniref:cbb3-type cytochrome c oxidase subunit I n=2 Tax=Bradyrhizobium TaxID=374 RepID=UPI001FCD4850|nr:cbb3-type cytochrome c oxidase subunit I [Bradyrhizobium viridifuturi]
MRDIKSQRRGSNVISGKAPAVRLAGISLTRKRKYWMIGSLMMCVGVVVLLFGMLAGIAMGIQHDFTLGPAHAHLNLVGGVLLFLFGLYYRLVPAAGRMLLAKIQGWLHIIGGVLFPAGVAAVLLEGPAFEAAPIVGSLMVVAAMALFTVVVFRTSRA